jgi:hypothetical protein
MQMLASHIKSKNNHSIQNISTKTNKLIIIRINIFLAFLLFKVNSSLAQTDLNSIDTLLCKEWKSQTTTLRFEDAGKSVPYVTVYDSVNHIFKTSDSIGVLKLHNERYHLITSHVSYYNYFLNIDEVVTDTVIHILLIPRQDWLQEVKVTSSKWHEKKGQCFETGSYHAKAMDHRFCTQR